jgi:hypothetical protein
MAWPALAFDMESIPDIAGLRALRDAPAKKAGLFRRLALIFFDSSSCATRRVIDLRQFRHDARNKDTRLGLAA